MKKAIITILLVILSVSALSAVAFTPKVKADPQDIKILSYSWYAYGSDEFIVVGEIQNQGTSTLDYVRLSGLVYNATGPVASNGCTAFVEDMLPQQKAPFYMDFTADSAINGDGDMSWITAVDHVDFNVIYANATTDQMYQGLIMAGSNSYTPAGQSGPYTVTGIIRNSGTQSSGKLWVVTTFYNASGTAVAVNYTNFLVQDSLPPQGTVSFQATPIDYAQINSQITNYTLLIQNRPIDNTTATPSPTQTANSSPPTASPTSSQQPTQTTSPPQNALSPEVTYAIVGAVIIIVAIAVMLTIRKRRK